MSAIAKRYAKALVEAFLEKNQDKGPGLSFDELVSSLTTVQDAMRKSAELRDVLTNPLFKAERSAVLAAVLPKLNVNEFAAKLVMLIAENGRIALFDSVLEVVEQLGDERAGRQRALVRSAIPLDAAHTQRISKALEKRIGRQVAVTVQVEPELLGGLVCQLGDLTLDSSLKRQLEMLRERLETSAI